MVRVKICGIHQEEELKTAVEAGADAVGFLVGQLHPSPDFILPGTAGRLAAMLPPWVTPVLVTHLTEAEEILDIVDRTGITTIQLYDSPSAEQTAILRDKLAPAAKLILACFPSAKSDVTDYSDYYPLVNAFLIDSRDESAGKVGGTGIVNDWSIAARFVERSPLPVILAGGLCGENAAEAVRTVHPFGIDANSRLKGESGEKDPEKCRQFVLAANMQ